MRIFIIFTSIFLSSASYAADVTVEMLNKLDKETMVFSSKIVKIDIGDTVFWKATDPGTQCFVYDERWRPRRHR